MLSEHADIRVGGSSVDGVSRAGLNKIVGKHFAEGMRKPSRNGNPGELESVAAHRLSRHFLRARWRNPDDAEDMRVMEPFFRNLTPPQFHLCVSVLREFMQWRPGPAGRCRDRDAVSQQGGASKRRGDVVEAISVPDDALLPVGCCGSGYERKSPVQRAPPVGIAAYLAAPLPGHGFYGRHIAYEMSIQRADSQESYTTSSPSSESSPYHTDDGLLHQYSEKVAYNQLDVHERQDPLLLRPMEGLGVGVGGCMPSLPLAPEARGSACTPLPSYLKTAADTIMAECMDMTQRGPRTSTRTSSSSMPHNPGTQHPLMQALARDDQHHQHQQNHGPTLEHLHNVGVIGSAAIAAPLLQSDLSSNYNYLANAVMDHNHTTMGVTHGAGAGAAGGGGGTGSYTFQEDLGFARGSANGSCNGFRSLEEPTPLWGGGGGYYFNYGGC